VSGERCRPNAWVCCDYRNVTSFPSHACVRWATHAQCMSLLWLQKCYKFSSRVLTKAYVYVQHIVHHERYVLAFT